MRDVIQNIASFTIGECFDDGFHLFSIVELLEQKLFGVFKRIVRGVEVFIGSFREFFFFLLEKWIICFEVKCLSECLFEFLVVLGLGSCIGGELGEELF